MRRILLSLLILIFTLSFSVSCGKNSDDTVNKVSKEVVNDEEDTNNTSSESSNSIELNKFIPDGTYSVEYVGSDSAPIPISIKGDGSKYQVIGTNGKSHYIEVFNLRDDGIYRVYSDQLTEEQYGDWENINYLDKTSETNAKIVGSPLKLGTKWDDKEIVDIGKNLSINGQDFEMSYIKVLQKSKDTTSEIYYCENIGLVYYKVMLNDSVVEELTLKNIVKR